MATDFWRPIGDSKPKMQEKKSVYVRASWPGIQPWNTSSAPVQKERFVIPYQFFLVSRLSPDLYTLWALQDQQAGNLD
jgi:hypothetical protein